MFISIRGRLIKFIQKPFNTPCIMPRFSSAIPTFSYKLTSFCSPFFSSSNRANSFQLASVFDHLWPLSLTLYFLFVVDNVDKSFGHFLYHAANCPRSRDFGLLTVMTKMILDEIKNFNWNIDLPRENFTVTRYEQKFPRNKNHCARSFGA